MSAGETKMLADNSAVNRFVQGRSSLAACQRDAFRLYCYSSAIIPDTLQQQAAELIVETSLIFCLNARRLHAMARVHPSEIGPIDQYIAPEAKDFGYVTSYWDSINHIIHADSLVCVSANSTHQKWLLNSNHHIVGVDTFTAKGDRRRINIFGLCVSFLGTPLVLAQQRLEELGRQLGNLVSAGDAGTVEAAHPFPRTSLEAVGGMGRRWYSGPAIPEGEWQPAMDAGKRNRWGREYDESGS